MDGESLLPHAVKETAQFSINTHAFPVLDPYQACM